MNISESLEKINIIKKKLHGRLIQMSVFKIDLKGEHYVSSYEINFADVEILEKNEIIYISFPEKLSMFNGYLINEESWTIHSGKGLMNFYTGDFLKLQFNFHYK